MPPATAGASAARAREHLLGLLTPLVSESGFDLEDISVSGAVRRSLIRVTVDADGGIDLDAVAVVSRVVSDALDSDPTTEELLAGSYVLEVSSPGVDRPLTEPRHWRRAVGRRVTAQAGARTVTGRITAADDRGVTLDVDGTSRTIGWDDLGRGKVQIEFNRPEED